MTTSVVLGLDIASRTGWCRFDGVSFETGAIECTPKNNSQPEGVRFRAVQEAVCRWGYVPDAPSRRREIIGEIIGRRCAVAAHDSPVIGGRP